MKEIPGYEGLYAACEDGTIISLRSGKKMTESISKTNQYILIRLCKNGKQVPIRAHRIIATLFIPNPENKCDVNHKNGVKNDNRVENLEWCTRSENITHLYRVLGRVPVTGNRHPKYKPIIDLQTGIFYESTFEAAKAKNINRDRLKNSLKKDNRKFGMSWQC